MCTYYWISTANSYSMWYYTYVHNETVIIFTPFVRFLLISLCADNKIPDRISPGRLVLGLPDHPASGRGGGAQQVGEDAARPGGAAAAAWLQRGGEPCDATSGCQTEGCGPGDLVP